MVIVLRLIYHLAVNDTYIYLSTAPGTRKNTRRIYTQSDIWKAFQNCRSLQASGIWKNFQICLVVWNNYSFGVYDEDGDEENCERALICTALQIKK